MKSVSKLCRVVLTRFHWITWHGARPGTLRHTSTCSFPVPDTRHRVPGCASKHTSTNIPHRAVATVQHHTSCSVTYTRPNTRALSRGSDCDARKPLVASSATLDHWTAAASMASNPSRVKADALALAAGELAANGDTDRAIAVYVDAIQEFIAARNGALGLQRPSPPLRCPAGTCACR